jgi:hypothetical protein
MNGVQGVSFSMIDIVLILGICSGDAGLTLKRQRSASIPPTVFA